MQNITDDKRVKKTRLDENITDDFETRQYKNQTYDWLQISEIEKGLERGVDVSVYADPAISYDTMRELRKGLEVGVNLYDFKDFSANKLKVVRRAIRAGADISEYVRQGYSAGQLDVIIAALRERIDISPYIMPSIRSVAMKEILAGLEEGLDVGIYAGGDYDWRQMRQIRLGLENRVSVSYYLHPFYDWEQMREIRIGLEKGMDVTPFARIMYTAGDMRRIKRRMKLTALGLVQKQALNHVTNQQSYVLPLEVLISEDGMKAELFVSDKCIKAGTDLLLDSLRNHGIVFGYDMAAIEAITAGKYTAGDMVTVAKGKSSEAGIDGRYEFLFKTKIERTPKILEDGSVDYQNIDWFEPVKKKQVVAKYHRPKRGASGTTVTGERIPGNIGNDRPPLKGRGFILGDDGTSYISIMDGRIELINGNIIISSIFVLDEVTTTTGRVDVDGSVHILGNVGSGAFIKAAGDIVIDGYVEDAIIESGANILIKKGANGGFQGHINANGAIVSGFFEYAKVCSKKDISCNYSLDSDIHTDGSIVFAGDRGSLMGGNTYAAAGIKARTLGTSAGLATTLRIGADESTKKDFVLAKKELEEADCEIIELKKAWCDIREKYPPEKRNAMPLFIKIENAIYTKEKDYGEILEMQKQLAKKLEISKTASAKITNTVYDGVTVKIDDMQWQSYEQHNITIEKINNKLTVYTNK